MKPWELLVVYEAFELIAGLSRSEQVSVRRCFEQIREHPHNHSDYSESDSAGRPVEIHICGRLALKYWIDEADRQVKILDIHPADRRK